VADAARSVFGDRAVGDRASGGRAGQVVRPDGTGRWLFDLPAANRLVLRGAGLPDGSIHTTSHVTGDGIFFSDRSVRPCGRFALVARLKETSIKETRLKETGLMESTP
jgi:copper oxidase (laccase) domain-containing protein